MSTLNQMQVGGVVYDIEDSAAREEAIKLKADKLGKTETAADSDKLGGQDASKYALSVDVLTMDLLWTNESPTSSFEPQTIPIDLSGYSHVMIANRRYAVNNTTLNTIAKVGEQAILFSVFCADGVYKFDMTSRFIKVNVNGIEFEDAYGVNAVDNRAINNSYNVPCRIYGIKGVGA